MGAPGQRAVVFVTTGFDEWQLQLTRGVETAAEGRPVLVINAYDPSGDDFLRPIAELISGYPCAGVLASACVSTHEEESLLGLLRRKQVPVVRLSMPTDGMTSVRADDVAGMRQVMAHVLDELGARRPVLVRGMRHHPDAQRREQVFREELQARGIPVDEELMVDGQFWHDAAFHNLTALLARRRDMDAVIAANDNSAVGALRALTDAGLRVPDDVLLTGFDNLQAATCWPGLTTVDNDLGGQGAAAARQLLAQLDGAPPVPEVLVPGRLVVRGSTVVPSDVVREVNAAAQLAQHRLSVSDTLRSLSYRLNNARTPEQLAEVLATDGAPALGIRRCFLAVFTGEHVAERVGERPRDVHGIGPTKVKLLLDYRDGAMQPLDGEEFPLTQVLPERLRDELESGLLVLEPLLAADGMFGYLLCDQSGNSWLPDWLRGDLSRNLDAMLSRQALERYAGELEIAVKERTAELELRKAHLETEVVMRRETERKLQLANLQLQRLAMSDSLTGLANRTALEQHLEHHWHTLARTGGELAVLLTDVDLFKAYNDHYGHVAGDETLRIVAQLLSDVARYPDDLACRFGGEEFLLVLPGVGAEAAHRVATRFRERLARAAIPHAASNVADIVTVSVGICAGKAGDDVPRIRLLEAADRALYLAKTSGRNRVCTAELDQHGDEVWPARTPRAATAGDPPELTPAR